MNINSHSLLLGVKQAVNLGVIKWAVGVVKIDKKDMFHHKKMSHKTDTVFLLKSSFVGNENWKVNPKVIK